MVPKETMRWKEWSYASRLIYTWLRVYDSVDMNFDVVLDGVGIVGTGRLASII